MTPGVVRWFDGEGWTETTRPTTPPPPPVPVAVPVPADPWARDAAYGQPVGFGAPAQSTFGSGFGAPAQSTFGSGFGTGQATAPYGSTFGQQGSTVPLGRLVDEAAIRSARRATLWSLAVGVFALVVGGVLALIRARALELGLTENGGHAISTGGLISATLAFVRAGRSYRSMVEQGGDPWSPARTTVVLAVAGSAALLAVVGIVQVARASSLPPMGPAVAGSCWAGRTQGESVRVMQVRCERDHQFVGTLVVRDSAGTECPAQTDSVLDLADGTGYYLCLALAPPT